MYVNFRLFIWRQDGIKKRTQLLIVDRIWFKFDLGHLVTVYHIPYLLNVGIELYSILRTKLDNK